jgi:heterodisulfide reductase subunit C
MVQQIIFALVTIMAIYWAFRQFSKIRRNIFLGKKKTIDGHESERWKRVFLISFGQLKMFERWIPAVLHFFIYAAFIITQIELIEILVDGFFGTHRFFSNSLGGFYTFVISLIELLSVGAFIATIIFLARRNLLKVPRFQKQEMTWWPKLDANLILFGEIALIIGIFCMNGSDIVLQELRPQDYHHTGSFAISGWLGPMLLGGIPPDWLVFLERFGWWLHIITVYAFLNYLPASKHLHILFAFPNVYYSRIDSRGRMENMPEIMNEVKSMMGLAPEGNAEMGEDIPEFGAKDIFDLTWKNILDAYTCTECGRCTDVCPANQTGKKLSPRKIMMDIRDRTEEIGRRLDDKNISSDKSYDDGKSLFDYISKEEIHACTTCNACVEACPVLIDPLDPILKLRRYEILTLSEGPADWMPMFTSLENSGSVWQVPDERVAWTKS